MQGEVGSDGADQRRHATRRALDRGRSHGCFRSAVCGCPARGRGRCRARGGCPVRGTGDVRNGLCGPRRGTHRRDCGSHRGGLERRTGEARSCGRGRGLLPQQVVGQLCQRPAVVGGDHPVMDGLRDEDGVEDPHCVKVVSGERAAVGAGTQCRGLAVEHPRGPSCAGPVAASLGSCWIDVPPSRRRATRTASHAFRIGSQARGWSAQRSRPTGGHPAGRRAVSFWIHKGGGRALSPAGRGSDGRCGMTAPLAGRSSARTQPPDGPSSNHDRCHAGCIGVLRGGTES